MIANFDWSAILLPLVDFLKSNGLRLLFMLTVVVLLERIVVYLANRYIDDDGRRHTVKKWTKYSALLVAVVWILLTYGLHRRHDVYVVLGILFAGAAISFRDVFANCVGWLVIISPRGFSHGDRIRLGTVCGDVIDIGIFRSTIAEIGDWVEADQSTGRLVLIPNSMILANPLYNYTKGHDFLWNEFKVMITFESDWKRAEEILLEIANKDFEQKKTQILARLKDVRKHFFLQYGHVAPKVYVSVADSGIVLTLRHMVRARQRRTLDDRFARSVLERFALEPHVDFAYPTMRLYQSPADRAEPPVPPSTVDRRARPDGVS
jgi:small-conductance mechanosensitive channel